MTTPRWYWQCERDTFQQCVISVLGNDMEYEWIFMFPKTYLLSFFSLYIRCQNLIWMIRKIPKPAFISWWRHQMETFSASLAICAGNSPVSGEFLAQRPVTRGFGVFFDLPLNKRLSKQSWGWWLETLSCSLWRQSNVLSYISAKNFLCWPVMI